MKELEALSGVSNALENEGTYHPTSCLRSKPCANLEDHEGCFQQFPELRVLGGAPADNSRQIFGHDPHQEAAPLAQTEACTVEVAE